MSSALSWRFIGVCALAFAACVVLAGLAGDGATLARGGAAAAGRWGVGIVYVGGAAYLARTREEWLAALIANGPIALGAGLAAGVVARVAIAGASAAPLRTLGSLALPIVIAGILAPAVGALVRARTRTLGDSTSST